MGTLLNRRRYMGDASLPYDAEIEYIEGTGTQYIATDIEGNRYTESLEVEVTFYYVDKWGTKESHILSAKNMPTANSGFCTFISSNNKLTSWVISGSAAQFGTLTLGERYRMKVVFNKPNGRVHTLNKVTSTTSSSNNYTNGGTIVLFMDSSYGVSQYASPAKIRVYRAKVTSDGFIIADFIPVRVGQVGYMYDKISGKLYGNSGTGDFVLGNDIVPIEYLQTTGTQYIDTDYKPNNNTELQINYVVTKLHSSLANPLTPYGCRVGWLNKQYCIFSPVNYADECHISYGNKDERLEGVPVLNQEIIVHANGNTVTFGSITKTFVTGNLPNLNIFLFGLNNNGSLFSVSGFELNIISFWIKEGGQFIIDMIPVRVGQIGYMYDKVSGTLFGNAGTGDFILGPDKTA